MKDKSELTFFEQTKNMLGIELKVHYLGGIINEHDETERLAGLDEIRKSLKEIVERHIEYKKMIPTSWRETRSRLRSTLSAYEVISYKEFQDMCKGKVELGSVAKLLDWFETTGICFIVEDRDDVTDKKIYSPLRMMLGIRKVLELAREHSGKINIKTLGVADILYEEVITPAAEPFTDKDVEILFDLLTRNGLCSKIRENYIFPLYARFPGNLVDDFRKKLFSTDDNTLHYIGIFDFVSSSILSAIVLKAFALFKDGEYGFEPIPDDEQERQVYQQPLKSWTAMSADGALFMINSTEQSSQLNRLLSVYVGRSLDLGGRIHFYIHCEGENENASESEKAEVRELLREVMSVLMVAVKSVYEQAAGYRGKLSTYHYVVDVKKNEVQSWIPVESIERYVDAGYWELFIALLNQNVDTKQLESDYHAPIKKTE
jgi:hypothetical protein